LCYFQSDPLWSHAIISSRFHKALLEIVLFFLYSTIKIKGSKVLVLGITFKENCPDVRNTKVVDVISHLNNYGMNVTIYDPWANPTEVQEVYKLESTQNIPNESFDAIVLTVAHKEFIELDLKPLLKKKSVVYDVKGVLGHKADAKL